MHRPYFGSLIPRRELRHAGQEIEHVVRPFGLDDDPHAGGDLVVILVHLVVIVVHRTPPVSWTGSAPSSRSCWNVSTCPVNDAGCDPPAAATRSTGHDGDGLADRGHTGSQLGGRFSRNAANASAMLSP